MMLKPSIENTADWLAAKPAGHFTIEKWGGGWMITVSPVEGPVETIRAETPGEVNRLRQKLSDEGMCGFVSEKQR